MAIEVTISVFKLNRNNREQQMPSGINRSAYHVISGRYYISVYHVSDKYSTTTLNLTKEKKLGERW